MPIYLGLVHEVPPPQTAVMGAQRRELSWDAVLFSIHHRLKDRGKWK